MVKDGWVYCPICNNKTRTKIRPDTSAINLPVYCPKCKNTTTANFRDGKEDTDLFSVEIPKKDKGKKCFECKKYQHSCLSLPHISACAFFEGK